VDGLETSARRDRARRVAPAAGLTAAATAGPDTAKQRVAITVTMSSGRAVLTPLNDGALERDTGTFGGDTGLQPRTAP
jgi:hypothetical protein